MRFLRAVKFDATEDHVFVTTALRDEIVVSGAFEFSDIAEEALTGKTAQAFAGGFLGVGSFGRTTFAVVSDITEAEFAQMIDDLTRHFIDIYGAPNRQEAERAARDEATFVEDLCKNNLLNTIFAVSRTLDDDGIHEEFRVIKPPADGIHTRIWNVVEDDEELSNG